MNVKLTRYIKHACVLALLNDVACEPNSLTTQVTDAENITVTKNKLTQR